MLFSQRPFSQPEVEAAFQEDRKERLADRDMRSALIFVLLWAFEVARFFGRASVGSMVKATVWLVAVGLKPVYVYWIVGRPFYTQYRAWIITFTKTVFAMHPPGEHLHLEALAALPAASAAQHGTLRLLWLLAAGARLPYMLVTGLGWQDFFHNIPIQLALVGRAVCDIQAQCATPYFDAPRSQALLRGVANQLTSLLSALLRLAAGIKGQQDSFPAGLDPCVALGSWGAICFGFLLTTLVVASSEHRARAQFACRHAECLTPYERQHWCGPRVDGEEGCGGWWAAWVALAALLGFVCLLVWEVLLAALSWSGGEPA